MSGRSRSSNGPVQHGCTALARAEVKAALLEMHDTLDAPESELWLFDEDHDLRYGQLPRNDRVEFETLEHVDRLHEHPRLRGTWLFRVIFVDGLVVEDCEISNIDAEWPTVLAPKLSRSDRRYAYVYPESAQRIATLIRGMFGGDAPYGRTGTG